MRRAAWIAFLSLLLVGSISSPALAFDVGPVPIQLQITKLFFRGGAPQAPEVRITVDIPPSSTVERVVQPREVEILQGRCFNTGVTTLCDPFDVHSDVAPVATTVQRTDKLDFVIGLHAPTLIMQVPLTVNLFTGAFTLHNIAEPLFAGDPGETCQSQFLSNGDRWGVCWTLAGICQQACSNGSAQTCTGDPCTTGPNTIPACSGIPGTVSCSGGTACLPNPAPVDQQPVDCGALLDHCGADQVGKSFACTTASGSCPHVAGVRTCTTANAPPGPCVANGANNPNFCQVKCANEVQVANVAELREGIAQAHLTPCKDVIVLQPGVYSLDTSLQIDDSMEIRGIGSSFDCEGIALDDALVTSELDSQIGSLRCDGDGGEDPGATTLLNTARTPVGGINVHRVMEIGSQNTLPEITLRHLTISGGFGSDEAQPATGILSQGGPLKLFNVRVEDNEARGPTAGLRHLGTPSSYPVSPTFVMVNSTIRRNRSTTPALGNGIGLQGNGGGIQVSGVSFILRSTINDNAGIRGAGLLALGTMHVFNSTITRNLAGQGAAGIYYAPDATVGGILELRDNTITNNFAQWFSQQPATRDEGAGVLALGGVIGDHPLNQGVVEMYGNVIADNVLCQSQDFQGKNSANCKADEGASIRSLGGNVGSADCGFVASGTFPGSGSAISDKVLNLGYARDLTNPSFTRSPDAYHTAVDATCDIGSALGGNFDAPQLSVAQVQAAAAMPPSDHLVFDRISNQHMTLFGTLADQGGPTQTLAPQLGTPELGAVQSLEEGSIGDGFPSTPPLCPTADQRGLQVSSFPPSTCDAGSFQSVVFMTLAFVDSMQTMFPDGDGDGIANVIDENPAQSSLAFNDFAAGGITQGHIVTRGDQVLRLFDAYPNPDAGILVIALSSGGSTPAQLEACNGAVQLSIGAGQTRVMTCPQQPDLCVLATDTLTAGDRVYFNVTGVFGKQVTFGPSNLTSNLYSVSGTALTRASIAGSVISAGTVQGASQSTIGASVSQNAYVLPRKLASTSVPFGTTDVILGNDQSRSITPGSYRTLVVGDRSVLTLSGGNYFFQSAVFQNDSRLVLTGVVHVQTDSALTVMDRVRITDSQGAPASGALTDWYTNAANVAIGHDAVWAGSIVAPSAHVVLMDRGLLDGCLAGRQLDFNNDSTISAQRFLPTGRISTLPPPAPSCTDGIRNQNETDVDCGGACGATCKLGGHCGANSDCNQGTCVSGVCTAAGGGACTEATAIDLGVPGQQSTLNNGGCFRVRDGYPSWWGVRTMKLETTTPGTYPVPFTWTNTCTGHSGTGTFTGDWQAQHLAGISSSCATLVDLLGSGAGNVNLRYWAE